METDASRALEGAGYHTCFPLALIEPYGVDMGEYPGVPSSGTRKIMLVSQTPFSIMEI